jgi:predicted amidophosphoribosyltransferase
MKLKFAGTRAVALAFAPAMAGAMPEGLAGRTSAQAVITWVPLGRGRRRRRGFDQAEVLARAVGSLVGVPVTRLLVRPEETSPQARRGGADRRRALAGAFRAVARPPPLVILVDDVLTSGATAAECASVLLGAGAIEVGVLTAARSLGGPIPARCYSAA